VWYLRLKPLLYLDGVGTKPALSAICVLRLVATVSSPLLLIRIKLKCGSPLLQTLVVLPPGDTGPFIRVNVK